MILASEVGIQSGKTPSEIGIQDGFYRQNLGCTVQDVGESTNVHWGYKTNHEYNTGEIVESLTNMNKHEVFGYRRIGEFPQTKPF